MSITVLRDRLHRHDSTVRQQRELQRAQQAAQSPRLQLLGLTAYNHL